MRIKKRISMAVVVVLMAFLLWYAMEDSIKENENVTQQEKKDISLEVWYSDESLQAYVESAAKDYEKKTHVKVNTKQLAEIDYIQMIHDGSVGENFEGPDVYLVTNDQLEMVELAGLTSVVEKHKEHYSGDYYADTALHAVRYNGNQIAYPISFETSFLLYNKDYAQIPKTIDELKDFSEKFEGADGVENIFRFDVSDIFYTYFFVGNYLKLGGLDGDNAGVVDVANENVIQCLNSFQELAQFFAIDIKTINYETVLSEFANGKTVYIIGKTDAVQKLSELQKETGRELNYGIALLPDISDELSTKSLSVTTAAVVNGYTRNKEEADKFADYLSYGYADHLYETTGKYAAKRNVKTPDNVYRDEIYAQYEKSVSLPKLLNASNFWVNLEIAFFNIWTGEDVQEQIQAVSDQVTKQLNN